MKIADESPAADSETKAEAEQETHTTAAEAGIRYELVEETVQVPILEENPKWHLLTEVLKEIEEASGGSGGQTLIMVKDERTCMQLQEYLAVGGKRMYAYPRSFMPCTLPSHCVCRVVSVGQA